MKCGQFWAILDFVESRRPTFINLVSVLLINSYQIRKERDRVTFVMEVHQSNKYIFKLKLNNPFQNIAPDSLQIHVLIACSAFTLVYYWLFHGYAALLMTLSSHMGFYACYYQTNILAQGSQWLLLLWILSLAELSNFSFMFQLECPHLSIINLYHNYFYVFMQPPGCDVFKGRFHILLIFV